jgi:hypothetical protein
MRPSPQTIKKLFALSGNRCAFPNCASDIVCEGAVIGQVCHIKAAKPEAPRYDKNQSNTERHSFKNLILLCANHHKVIDDDEATYTVERIIKLKKQHEASSTRLSEYDATTGAALLMCVNQYGGITAQQIHANTINIHPPVSHTNQVPNLAQEFEKTARGILNAFERLSNKVSAGTQNDDEGVLIQTGINNAVWNLRAKTQELLDQPEISIGRAPKMRKAIEAVYEVVATILNQKAGSLQTLETAISDLLRERRNLER